MTQTNSFSERPSSTYRTPKTGCYRILVLRKFVLFGVLCFLFVLVCLVFCVCVCVFAFGVFCFLVFCFVCLGVF